MSGRGGKASFVSSHMDTRHAFRSLRNARVAVRKSGDAKRRPTCFTRLVPDEGLPLKFSVWSVPIIR